MSRACLGLAQKYPLFEPPPAGVAHPRDRVLYGNTVPMTQSAERGSLSPLRRRHSAARFPRKSGGGEAAARRGASGGAALESPSGERRGDRFLGDEALFRAGVHLVSVPVLERHRVLRGARGAVFPAGFGVRAVRARHGGFRRGAPREGAPTRGAGAATQEGIDPEAEQPSERLRKACRFAANQPQPPLRRAAEAPIAAPSHGVGATNLLAARECGFAWLGEAAAGGAREGNHAPLVGALLEERGGRVSAPAAAPQRADGGLRAGRSRRHAPAARAGVSGAVERGERGADGEVGARPGSEA